MSNITTVLKTLNIDFRNGGETKHIRIGWVGLKCPWCDNGKGNYGLGINLEGNGCSCWACGKHSIVDVLRAYTKLPFAELKRLVGNVTPVWKKTEVQSTGTLQIPNGVGPLLQCHRRYLKQRKFDPDEIADVWNVQGIGALEDLAWRLFIPIHNNGEIASWTTRATTDNTGQRYISADATKESVHHKHLLYGEDHVRDTIVVCEGPTDVWRIGPGAVATFGLTVTTAQVKRIAKYPRRLLLFDRERKAQQTAKRLARNLASFPGETLVINLDAPDPGSASEEELSSLRRLIRGEQQD